MLKSYGLRSSMGDVGACWDNAVMERFWGSLKHEWLLLVAQPTRANMKQDVATYIRHYNLDRNHAANGGLSPALYERLTEKKCPVLIDQNKRLEEGQFIWPAVRDGKIAITRSQLALTL